MLCAQSPNGELPAVDQFERTIAQALKPAFHCALYGTTK
jgi:hypothetical protein